MLCRDVVECSFSNWYPKFQDVTIPSEIIEMSDEFIAYLLRNGIVLHNPKRFVEDDESGVEKEEDEIEENDEDDENSEDRFPEIEDQITDCIQKFGHVFPKTNWSSCDDAQWVQAMRTKCDSIFEILLLLQSSDKTVFDLTEPFKHCEDVDSAPKVEYHLILRKWLNINPSTEFRCFIVNNHIVGITQRDVRAYYDFLHKEKSNILNKILTFFQHHVQNKIVLQDFVIDIFMDGHAEVVLMDVNPFGEMTDSLLFDWDELEEIRRSSTPVTTPDFRYIETNIGVQNPRYQLNSLPIDVLNGNLEALQMAENALDIEDSSSSSEDEDVDDVRGE